MVSRMRYQELFEVEEQKREVYMRLQEIETPILGYKAMRWINGKAVSGANSRIGFTPRVGEIISMPENGIYMSTDKNYVMTYYTGLHNEEVVITFEFYPSDIIVGTLEDREVEIGVSKAKIVGVDFL